MMETTPDGARTLTAVYDDAAKAERAVAWLRNIGVQDSQIRQSVDATARPASAPQAPSPPPAKRRRGFMDSFVDFIFPEGGSDQKAGGRLVTVTDIAPDLYDKVVAILNDEGKIKLESRKADISGTSGIKGFIGACLVDSDSGLMLASQGGEDGKLNFDLVAALNSETVKAKQTAVQALGLNQHIEDILITLDKQVHLIRPLERNRSVFVYVALDKATSNLGMARLQLKSLESGMAI
jgi:predicted regulator of Ras-like GTPase activity (Roadblock/LC7/MglB family)